jgi:hypothetical protein
MCGTKLDVNVGSYTRAVNFNKTVGGIFRRPTIKSVGLNSILWLIVVTIAGKIK